MDGARRGWLESVVVVTALSLAPACTSDPAPPTGATDGGVVEGDAGAEDAGGEGPDGGGGPTGPSLSDVVADGSPAVATTARPAYGALRAERDGERVYVVESRRDVEPGPYGLPWRSRFRLAAYDAGEESWAFEAEPDDLVSDLAVHPSGEVTIAVLRHPPDRLAYELVRLSPGGAVVSTTTLPQPSSIPDEDYAATDPRPLFRMKSAFADATTAGWVRLLPDGEGLALAFLSFVDAPEDDPLRTRMALGVARFAYEAEAYVERWARVVEGPHAADPAAWAYDELRWREQAVRPFLARDEATSDLLVGRAWNTSRCRANVATFAEFTAQDCVLGAASVLENERLPLAVTRFDATGKRLGTRVLAPDADAVEQVPFALAARGGELAVVGAVVRALEDGSRRTYQDGGTFVDYDGYAAIYDREGTLLRHRDVNLGRGDVLAALRFTEDGLLAAGSAGWNRWVGGMSISRGCDPLLVFVSHDTTRSVARVVPLSDGSRHFSLHDVVASPRAVVGYGFSDAPMTHSADGGKTAQRTFGSLVVGLSVP